MSAPIHPTAIVQAGAQLDASVTIGPYTVIGPHVRIGAGTEVGAHCVIQGHTCIGQDNHIYPFASLGAAPQDKKYAGEPTQLQIGDRNTIREFCTFNTGTVQDRGITQIGDDNWIMAYVHIAHDCIVGQHTILANNATLAGHVRVGDWAIIGGLTGIHQYTQVGAHVMAGFASHISQDVPPFMMVDGNPLAGRGCNLEGLRRRGFSAERIATVKHMHRLLYRQGLTLQAARQAIAELLDSAAAENSTESRAESCADIAQMLAFLDGATRGLAR